MAQKDLKLLWGSNTKISGDNKPAIVDGKAYFAIVDGTTKYPDAAAPANEAFIYFDKDNTRYNVIAKRAIFDALGNKINSTYATDIESGGNTMSLFSADGGEAINSATIINSLSVAWAAASDPATSGPRICTTVNGQNSAYSEIPVASDTAAGIVTTGDQKFAGIKTFTNTTDSSSAATGAVVIKGGLGVAKKLYVGTVANIGTSLSVGTTATIGTTLSVGSGASFGGTITVAGKNIYLNNQTNKIVTLASNNEGTVVTLGNSNADSLAFRLYNKGAQANFIELNRNTNASWRITNSGYLYLQCNYTDKAGDYYDVLTLAYNTGNATLKGKLEVDTLAITNTDTIAHIAFSRANNNYISAPAEGGIAFSTNGHELNANTDLVLYNRQLWPGSPDDSSLGTLGKPWRYVYAQELNSATTLYIGSAKGTSIIFEQNNLESGRFDPSGSLKITNSIYPAVNNSTGSTLGTSSLYWNHVYSTNFTGTTFTGTTFTGNAASATKVYVTDTAAPTGTDINVYRLLFANGSTSDNQDVRFYDSLTYTVAPGIVGSILTIGGNRKGSLQLSDGSNNIVTITPVSLTSDRTIKISDHGGTMMTSGNYTQWASPSTHTHDVTISHTPTGTISTPTFTGTANQETSGMAGTTSVPKAGHTHSYNRVSSISAHSLSTGSYTSSKNSGSGVAFYAYSSSSTPSLTASITSRCLTVTFTSPATNAYIAAPDEHTHTYNRVNSISNHTVSTSSYTTGETPFGSRVDVASNGHKHTYTAAGTISTPTFTGDAYSTTETTTTQNV